MPSVNLSIYTDFVPDVDVARDDQIYKDILQAIIDRRLKPGTRLPEDSLGDAFKVSRTIIRKALQRLAAQRLVTILPKRGAHVAQPSQQEARDVFYARRIVEPAIVGEILRNKESDAYRQLRIIAKKELKARNSGDWREEIYLSARFHVQLAIATGNEFLSEQVAHLTSITSLIISLYGSSESLGCKCGEHPELLDLLDEGKEKAAKKWLEMHLDKIYQSLKTDHDEASEIDFLALFNKA